MSNQTFKIMNTENTFAARCSVTGKGMWDGYVWGDGEFYTASNEDTLSRLREEREYLAYIAPHIDIDDEPIDYGNGIAFASDYTEDEQEELALAIKNIANNTDTNHDLWLVAQEVGYVYYTEWDADDEEEHRFKELETGEVVAI
tara:strand:- start:657 stop:1088 length:432 start_codon:yes stop_codon:yes gene_type:complete